VAVPRWTLAKGVVMTIGYIMLVILWIVIGVFVLAGILAVFRSAGR
jgi:hypothetical protein